MTINSKANRKIEEVEAMKKALLKTLHETHNFYLINCIYNQDIDHFSVYCFIDKNDDDAFITMKFDYDEAIARICDANIELLLRDRGV